MKRSAVLIYIMMGVGVAGESWERNTYPGPGHVENAGPWGEGQGSDRTEWISAFGVSPVNGKFMLQGTDLGRLVYTNTRLGGTEFIAANLPLYYVCGVAFHPTDGAVAYALMTANEMPGYSGWWRTEDEGEHWALLYATEGSSRGQSRLLEVDAQTGAIYIGTTTGLVRSLDNGASWETIGFAGESIKCIALSRDGRRLYCIPGEQAWASLTQVGPTEKGGTALWRMDDGEPTTLAVVDSSADKVFYYVDVHPEDAERGLLVRGNDLVEFREGGSNQTVLETRNNLCFGRYNPANPAHIISVSEGAIWWWAAFRWSTDGGVRWNSWADVGLTTGGATMGALVDYGPWNWKAEGYEYEKASAYLEENSSYNYLQGRVLFDYLPGDPDSVVMWAVSFGKGPLRSDDYGAQFRPFAHGGNFKRAAQVAFGSTAQRMALAVTEYGFVMTEDGGRSWRGYSRYNTANLDVPTQESTRTFEIRSAWGVAFDPEEDRTLIGIVGYQPGHIVRTEDFGANWTVVGEWRPYIPEGTSWYEDGNVYWHRQDPRVVYAGNRKSTDGGLSFPETLSYPVSAMSGSNGEHVVSKVSGEHWRVSLDGGSTWWQLPTPPVASDGQSRVTTGFSYKGHALDPHPPFGEIRLLSAGEGGIWAYTAPTSAVAGGSWRLISETAFGGDPYLDALGKPVWLTWIAYDPRPGYEAVVYTCSGVPPSNKDRGELLYRQIYRSADSGVTWRRIAGGEMQGELPDYLAPMAVGVNPSGEFVLADYAGLFTLAKTEYDKYLEANFGPNWEIEGYAAMDSDADGDGITEPYEYLFGLNPLQADAHHSVGNIVQQVTGGQHSIRVRRPVNRSGISLQIQRSENLLQWENVDWVSTVEVDLEDSQIEIHTFTDPEELSAVRPRFLRLSIRPQ